MNEFFKFMASPAGRITRIVAGVGLILWGTVFSEEISIPLLLIGLIPLSAGLFDVCYLAPLGGKPLSGEKIRQEVQ